VLVLQLVLVPVLELVLVRLLVLVLLVLALQDIQHQALRCIPQVQLLLNHQSGGPLQPPLAALHRIHIRGVSLVPVLVLVAQEHLYNQALNNWLPLLHQRLAPLVALPMGQGGLCRDMYSQQLVLDLLQQPWLHRDDLQEVSSRVVLVLWSQ
jgi:hypothetical protein